MRISATVVAACGLAVAFVPVANSAAGASVAKAAGPAPTVVASADRNCTLSPSLDYSGGDQASCIAVGAKLSRIPAVGQTATLKVTVKAARSESDTHVTIDLPATLKFADGTSTFAAVNGTGRVARANAAAMSLTAGESRSFTRTVKAVSAGFGEIAVSAKNRLTNDRTDGGTSSVFLTTGATANASFAGQAAGSTSGTVKSGPKATAAEAPAGRKPAGPPAALARPAARAETANAGAPGTSCATGTWNYVDQNGTSRPAFNTLVEILNSSNTLLSYAVSAGDGSYNI